MEELQATRTEEPTDESEWAAAAEALDRQEQEIPRLEDLPEVLTLGDVAAVLRVHRTTVTRLTQAGMIRRLPGLPRYAKDELIRYLRQGVTVEGAGSDP